MRGRWVLALGVALWLGAAGGRAEPPQADREKQRTALYQEGLKHAEAARWDEAVKLFRAVVAIRSAPRVRFTLGQAEEKSGRLASAKASYLQALEEARQKGDEEAAGAAGEALAAIERRVPRVVLRLPAGVDDVAVQVDGQAVAAPDAAVDLDPGEHRLVVQASGRTTFVKTLVATEGRTTELDVRLDPIAGGATMDHAAGGGTAPVEDSASDDDGGDAWGPPVGAWVLGGVGLAAAGAGLAVYLTGQSVYDEAAEACPTEVCLDPDQAADGNDARDQMIAGGVLLGVGLGALAGAGIWWAVAAAVGSPEPSTARLELMPSPEGFVLRFGGRL